MEISRPSATMRIGPGRNDHMTLITANMYVHIPPKRLKRSLAALVTRASKPAPKLDAKYYRSPGTGPWGACSHVREHDTPPPHPLWNPRAFAKSFPVPTGMTASAAPVPAIPLITSLTVPSPPIAHNIATLFSSPPRQGDGVPRPRGPDQVEVESQVRKGPYRLCFVFCCSSVAGIGVQDDYDTQLSAPHRYGITSRKSYLKFNTRGIIPAQAVPRASCP